MTNPIVVDRNWIRSTGVLRDRATVEQLICRVDEIGPALRESGEESERLGRLAPRAEDALRQTGLFHMASPHEIGGSGLSRTGQMIILSCLAEYDSSSAWVTMVRNTATAGIARTLGEAGRDLIFGTNPRSTASGVAAADGVATRVEGGYNVTGRWRFCSGIHGADWVICAATVGPQNADRIEVVVPRAHVVVHDDWNVIGMRGTGSAGFSMSDEFVPDALVNAHDVELPGAEGVDVYEHSAIAIGLGRRALRLLRGGLASRTIKAGDREVVQAELGRAFVTLASAEMLALHDVVAIDESDVATHSPESVTRLQAIATYATEVALDIARIALRRGGGRALYLPNEIERAMRDLTAAQAHVLVSDINYGAHGRALIEATTPDRSFA